MLKNSFTKWKNESCNSFGSCWFQNERSHYRLYLEKEGYSVSDFGSDIRKAMSIILIMDIPWQKQLKVVIVAWDISLCGSGNGINMVTNKHQGIRGALCWNREITILARSHNNANICSIPASFVDLEMAKEIVNLFLNTPYEGGRHQQRIEKIPL